MDTLTKLAEIFDVSVERIIYDKEKKNWHFSIKIGPEEGIGMGVALAMIISYTKWQSIGWATLHGIFNWAYVIYYVIKY